MLGVAVVVVVARVMGLARVVRVGVAGVMVVARVVG